jgi:hypothetical protein
MMEISIEARRDAGKKPEFLFTGFTQLAGIRTYTFEGRFEQRRVPSTVVVDMALIPVYGIRIQELPLLCRDLLLQGVDCEQASAFVFTEQQMRSHADQLAATRDAHSRKQPRYTPSPNRGGAWRMQS